MLAFDKSPGTYARWPTYLRGAFNKVPDFFMQAFKIVVDSWKFNILLLYILWDDFYLPTPLLG